MKRYHTMPFGAEILDGKSVRFRLWAPAARQVDIALQNKNILPLSSRPGGWFELITEQSAAGRTYRYRIDGNTWIPDPASRWNPEDVYGPSQVIDPCAFDWRDTAWQGRPWEEAVIYELHVGTFTPAGTFAGVQERLVHLAQLGVTAVELMPIADFPGARNWGYDGVLSFAPDSSYGTPDDLKELIQAAHSEGLMMFLDVVYNHFGPDGNYLHLYAPIFFSGGNATPWGTQINFGGPESRTVRDFFIHNALYWLEEFHFDGLRLDAVHAIHDESEPDILMELAEAVRAGPGKTRQIHLLLENDHNAARYLSREQDGKPRWYAAQINDDAHHALHVLLTGETGGYYADYAMAPARYLGRSLSEGFAYQGELSPFRDNHPRGEPSGFLPATAFINFLQSHDQIGNRAFGERLASLTEPAALHAAIAILLLAPSIPMLFMGEEFCTTQPFFFFCDFGPELASAIREGRRKEFARFGQLGKHALPPDPNARKTFLHSHLDWKTAEQPKHREWLISWRQLLALRRTEIIPRLYGMKGDSANYRVAGDTALSVSWTMGDGSTLTLFCNLGSKPLSGFPPPPSRVLWSTHPEPVSATGLMPRWMAAWFITEQAVPL